MGGTVLKHNANLPVTWPPGLRSSAPGVSLPSSLVAKAAAGSTLVSRDRAGLARSPLVRDRRASFPDAMGGLWRPGWRRVAFCGWGWRPLGPPTGVAERVEQCLRPERSGAGGAEKGLRLLGTWRRSSLARDLAVQPARRPKSTNPHARAQEEEWRRRNKTVLTYMAAAAVGMLGASYAAVPLYRLYCQVGLPLPRGRGPVGTSRDYCPERKNGLKKVTWPRSPRKFAAKLQVGPGPLWGSCCRVEFLGL